jgi:hypothetical protein
MHFLVKLTYGLAVVLIVIGAAAYLAAAEETRSFTALIPSIVGVLLLGTAMLANTPKTGRIGGIASAVLVLLMVLGSVPRGLVGFINAITSGGELNLAIITQVVVIVLGVIYLGIVAQHMMSNRKRAAA